ncbi:MAG: sulfate ABC transporter permease subunit CysW [Candidatus Eiseniibacteriota bacterium]
MVRRAAIALAVGFLALFLFLPLALVFAEAFSEGVGAYLAALADPVTLASIRLTLFVALACVPLNVVFGVAAAWAIARYRFPGRDLLLSFLDVPFAVSPVVSGMVFVLLFGAHGWFGPFLQDHGWRIIFAYPGILIATMFVTSPLVARELIPLMEAQGVHEEEAALTLGASAWRMFFRISLPKIKWGLVYGIVLCNARAMGEFGAVSVVSGHIRGRTTTVPLHVEMLYNEYQFAGAFAVASLLTLLALVTLVLQYVIGRHGGH